MSSRRCVEHRVDTYARYADEDTAFHGGFTHHGCLVKRFLVASTGVCGTRVIPGSEAIEVPDGRGDVGGQEGAGLRYIENKLG